MSTKPSRKQPVSNRSLVARTRRFIVDSELVRPSDRVLAAVSGGADSTALLLILCALRRSLKIEVQAAYFDHMLRGRRVIKREQRFLRTLCEGLNVPLLTGAADVRAHKSKQRLSLEEAARDLRYDFLRRIAKENACSAVATGHTEDDQAETVLLHIIRGTGLRGLAAMAPSARLPVKSEVRLVRPLLALSHTETEHYCREAGVEPIEDATNHSRAHLRNRVRHDLLPLLRRYNPRIEQALVRLSAAAADDGETLDQLVLETIATDAPKNSTLRISRRKLNELPNSMRARAVRSAIASLLGTTRSFSERNITAIVRAAVTTGTTLDLPLGVCLEVQREVLVLRQGGQAPTTSTRRVRLAVPGSAHLGAWMVSAKLLDRPPTRLGPRNGVPTALLDADALGTSLWLRSRRPGDRYQPLGLRRSKKLQDVLVDSHVPRSERDALPLLCGGEGIAWIVGQPPADWAKITEDTRRAVQVRAERTEP